MRKHVIKCWVNATHHCVGRAVGGRGKLDSGRWVGREVTLAGEMTV